jgi:hypothetical protein
MAFCGFLSNEIQPLKESFLFWGMAIKLRHNKLSPRLELSHFMRRQNNSTDDIFGLFLSKVWLLFNVLGHFLMSRGTFGCLRLLLEARCYLWMSWATYECLVILLYALGYFLMPLATFWCLGLLFDAFGYFLMPWATFGCCRLLLYGFGLLLDALGYFWTPWVTLGCFLNFKLTA